MGILVTGEVEIDLQLKHVQEYIKKCHDDELREIAVSVYLADSSLFDDVDGPDGGFLDPYYEELFEKLKAKYTLNELEEKLKELL